MNAIDTSEDTTGMAQSIQASGYEAVGVYLRADRCSTAMIADLHHAGLQVWSVYEKGFPTGDSYFTAAQGTTDGVRAASFAVTIGQPGGTQIYAAVDYDPDDSDPTGPTINGPISQYMTAFKAALNSSGYVASIYGSGRTCRILVAKGLAQTGWLAGSTGWAEYSAFAPRAGILQGKGISNDWDADTIANPALPGLW